MKPSRSQVLLVALAVGILFVAGLAVHGPVGGVLLLFVTAALVTLSIGARGHLRRQGRPVRMLIALAVTVLAFAKLAGRI